MVKKKIANGAKVLSSADRNRTGPWMANTIGYPSVSICMARPQRILHVSEAQLKLVPQGKTHLL